MLSVENVSFYKNFPWLFGLASRKKFWVDLMRYNSFPPYILITLFTYSLLPLKLRTFHSVIYDITNKCVAFYCWGSLIRIIHRCSMWFKHWFVNVRLPCGNTTWLWYVTAITKKRFTWKYSFPWISLMTKPPQATHHSSFISNLTSWS